MTATLIKPASAKSIAYLATLTGVERDDNYPEWALAMEEHGQAFVSAAIKIALATPKPDFKATLPLGLYRKSEEIFAVVSSKSGNSYAKKWDGSKFVYASGAIYNLTADMLLSLAEANAYSVAVHTCCMCGRKLTVKESQAKGMGPVCSARYGK
jgi:hypothetical protein